MVVESVKYWIEFQGGKTAAYDSLDALVAAIQADPWKATRLEAATLRIKLVTADQTGRRMVRRAWWPAKEIVALRDRAQRLGWNHIRLWSCLHDERSCRE